MNPPEIALWQALRTRSGGHKSRRHQSVGIYVHDFFCAETRQAIGVGGRAHDNASVIAKDEARSHFLRQRGIATTRIPAKLVLEDIEAVARRLVQICDERIMTMACSPLYQTSSDPPPLAGEDRA
jgi:very-short-patch-repair endonuclease